MSVIPGNTHDAGEGSTTDVLVVDVDQTLVPFDSGQELLHQAGIASRDEFDELMAEAEHPDLGKTSNELLYSLRDQDWNLEELEKVARQLPENPRNGLNSALKYRWENDMVSVASSAGWKPAIESVTNGYFEGKIYGTLEPWRPNGRHEKRDNLERYLEEHGLQNATVNAVGDSNGDLGLFHYAAETGGAGIAIGSDIEEAQNRVEEAAIYVGDDATHEYTAAVLKAIDSNEYELEHFVTEYGLDLSSGEAVPGELATEKHMAALEEVEGVRQSYISHV
jgi:phosphoserine phosphatase